MDFLKPEDMQYGIRLLVAAVLGGLIGLERETQGKEAGFRTYALVSLGSALAMVIAIQIQHMYPGPGVDPSRIASQVVSGIGFLGAGAIIRSKESGGIKGLTTAAGIWAVSGIGLACGLGAYPAAVMATALVLIVLFLFSKLDRFFHGKDH